MLWYFWSCPISAAIAESLFAASIAIRAITQFLWFEFDEEDTYRASIYRFFLCTLIDEQVFHLTNSQSVGQEKIFSSRDLSFQILFQTLNSF